MVKLSGGIELHLRDELLLTFQNAEFEFCRFEEKLKTQKDWTKMALMWREGYFIYAERSSGLICAESCAARCSPVLFIKSNEDSTEARVMAFHGDLDFHNLESGVSSGGLTIVKALNYNWFKNF